MGTKYPTIPISELQSQSPEMTAHCPVVLVVDDEPIIADSLVMIFKSRGYVADAAYDAESALEMTKIVPPELLISDVVMPGMSGIGLAIAVRETIPDCKVLLFSGQAATTDILAEARTKGHEFNVLTKPIHPHDLLARAARLLEQTA